MKGISAKVITDEDTVRMHTNFAEFKNVSVGMASSDIATWSKEDGVLKVHTNTIHDWGIQVRCNIPVDLLKAGQKYGVSVRLNNRNFMHLRIQTFNSVHCSIYIVKPHWDGDKLSSVCMLNEEDVVDDGIGISVFLIEDNADYEFRDFRIWEIDDLGGGNS